jgi:hypothetical protein
MAETAGRSTAIAVITAVPRWWGLWTRFNFWRIKWRRRLRIPSRMDKSLEKLSFIHFGHWSLFDRMPPRGGRRLRYPYILFQTNFNGDPHQYIEAFSVTVRLGMRGLWAGAYGVPSPVPIGPFVEYILGEKLETPYYYNAYPQASTTMVCAALRLRRELDGFARRSVALEPTRFKREYDEFVTRVQGLL